MKPERTKEEILSEVLKETLPIGKNIVLTYVETRWIYEAMEEYRQSSPVESKWVYGINSGCCFEGGGVWGDLYATEELAQQRFNELLAEKVKMREDSMEYYKDDEDPPIWKKQNRGNHVECWSDGYDYLAIDKLNVLSSLPELPIEETKEK